MTSTASPIPAVSQRVEKQIQDARDSSGDSDEVTDILFDAATRATAGGKRLRAQFCITGWKAVIEARGTAPDALPDEVIAAAASLEIFHAAALVHDDLIDNSDTRRGAPSAHRGIEAAHRGRYWAGNAAAFGRSGAILLGDLLVAWSDDLFESAITSHAHAAAARAQYATMRRDVTVGQFLDIAEEAAFVAAPDDTHADRALRVATMKSARYSIEQPLLIGATLAGADSTQLGILSRFGVPLGLAFQLRDDILGVYGDAAVTGKPAGDDLREGKRTLLIAHARTLVPPAVRRTIDELLGDPDLDVAQIEMLQETIASSGALERVERAIDGYAHDADRALAGAPLGNHAVGELRDLARSAVRRAS